MAGLDQVRVISEDGVSGAKRFDTREGGAELTAALAGGQAEHIVAMKMDRLFRDAEDALSQTRRWDKAGVALHIIDMGGGGALNTASPFGRAFLTITAAFAELERNLIRERTSGALQHKKSHRQVYSPVPFGFSEGPRCICGCGLPIAEARVQHQRNKTKAKGELVGNAAEAATVRTIREQYELGWSYRAIADSLNASKVPTKRGGKRWYASTVRAIAANNIHG